MIECSFRIDSRIVAGYWHILCRTPHSKLMQINTIGDLIDYAAEKEDNLHETEYSNQIGRPSSGKELPEIFLQSIRAN